MKRSLEVCSCGTWGSWCKTLTIFDSLYLNIYTSNLKVTKEEKEQQEKEATKKSRVDDNNHPHGQKRKLETGETRREMMLKCKLIRLASRNFISFCLCSESTYHVQDRFGVVFSASVCFGVGNHGKTPAHKCTDLRSSWPGSGNWYETNSFCELYHLIFIFFPNS